MKSDTGFLIFVTILVVTLLVALATQDRPGDKVQHCEARGGTMVMTIHGGVCARLEVVP